MGATKSSMDHGLKDLRKRSLALARTPGLSPWKLMARVYWRWWLAAGTFLSLFALFDFGFGWDAYRSNMSAYFPAVAVVIASLSTPRMLRTRTADSHRSRRAFLIAWGPYMLALLLFAVLMVGLESGLGWTLQKSVMVAAYFATGALAVALSAGNARAIRYELLAAEGGAPGASDTVDA